ncbi:MAG: glutathione S-transferase family protein, partial [Alphaproteobacteria bacterium]
MPELTLVGVDLSTYVRTARLACEEKGVSYALEMDHIGSLADLQSEAHLRYHPFGRIPVMLHDGFRLFEASAICRYIDASFDGPALIPGERRQAALMEQWISASNDYVSPRVIRSYVLKYAFPQTEDGQPDRAAIEQALPQVRETLKILNTALEEGPYLLGQS